MDPILVVLRSRADLWGAAGQLRSRVIALAVGGMLLAAGGYFVGDWEPVRVMMGSLAGAAWFIAGYLAWRGLVSDRVAEWMNFRVRFNVTTRRKIGAISVGVWFAALIGLSQVVTVSGSAFGAANVAILVAVWLLVTMTVEERAAALAVFLEKEEANIWEQGDGEPGVEAEAKASPKVNGKVSLLRRGLRKLVG